MESKIQADKVLKYKPKDTIITYGDSKPILYALGLGFSTDPMKEEDFKFTYELADGFTTFPTFSTAVDKFSTFEELDECPGFPKYNKNELLHGEQTTRIVNPLPISGSVLIKKKFEDIQDKGKGALLIASYSIYDAENPEKLYAFNTSRFYIRGLGGFGYKGTYPGLRFPKIAKTKKPDAVWEYKIREDQGILYRLNGDRNPHNIDPKKAAEGNFKRPLLQGHCYYGMTARAVYEHFCKGDA